MTENPSALPLVAALGIASKAQKTAKRGHETLEKDGLMSWQTTVLNFV